MFLDQDNQRALLFFSKGQIHKEFFQFMNFVALMEDLENDRMIIRLPIGQGTHNHFIGEMFDSK